jgi:uncharacterized membrane-anchored protein YhcB (DUF1043 family)
MRMKTNQVASQTNKFLCTTVLQQCFLFLDAALQWSKENHNKQELEKEIEELKKEIEMYQNVISTAFGSVSVMYEMFGKKLQEFVNKKAGKQVATLKYDSPTEE